MAIQATYNSKSILHPNNFMRQWWNSIDRTVFVIACLLLTIGVVLSFASSVPAAQRLDVPNPFYFVYKQSVFAVLAFTLMFALSQLSIDNARRVALIIYVVSLLLLLFILFKGHDAKGAKRWLRFMGFSLQPSEMMKPAALVLVSWVLTRRYYDNDFKGEWIALGLVAMPIAIFLRQPDVGQSILLSMSFLAVFWISGISLRWMAILGSMYVAGLALVFTFMPHVIDRVNVFKEGGEDKNSQVNRALDAISNGNFFGQGLGEGELKFGIPDCQTDFIFSLATEEWGFMGSVFLILLFAALVIRGINASSKQIDPFAQTAGIALFLVFGLQVGINLAVNLNLIPAKGMTLPFISYGGSSLFGSAITIGLALAITKRRATSVLQRHDTL